jgi:hypothetical protein
MDSKGRMLSGEPRGGMARGRGVVAQGDASDGLLVNPRGGLARPVASGGRLFAGDSGLKLIAARNAIEHPA